MKLNELKKISDADYEAYFIASLDKRDRVGNVRSNSCEDNSYTTPVDKISIANKRYVYTLSAMNVINVEHKFW